MEEKKKEYTLDEVLRKTGIKGYKIAEILGITKQAFFKKKEGVIYFKPDELEKISMLTGYDYYYVPPEPTKMRTSNIIFYKNYPEKED